MGLSIFGWQALGTALAQLLVIAIVAILVSLPALVVMGVLYRPGRQEMVESAIVIFAVALIGLIVGDLGGLSRTSVVGEIVPAILTLIGGFAVYLFGLKRPESRIANVAVLTFVVAFFIGYAYAAILRTDAEAFEFCKSKYSEAAILSSPDAMKAFNSQFSPYCSAIVRRHTIAAGSP